MNALSQSEEPGGVWLESLTFIDTPSACKAMGEASRPRISDPLGATD
jgi:hypothetical protein